MDEIREKIIHYKKLEDAKRLYMTKCKYIKIQYSLNFYNIKSILILNSNEESIPFSEKKLNLIRNVPYIVNIIGDNKNIELQIISEEYTHYIEHNTRIELIYNIHFPEVYSIMHSPHSTQALNELTGRLCSFHEDNDINHLEIFDSSEAEYDLSLGDADITTLKGENLEYYRYIGKFCL